MSQVISSEHELQCDVNCVRFGIKLCASVCFLCTADWHCATRFGRKWNRLVTDLDQRLFVSLNVHCFFVFNVFMRWLVWPSGNGVRHINKVKLLRVRLVLWFLTTFNRSIPSPYLSRPLRPTQPGHPSVGRCNEYRRWFQPSLGRNGASEVTT